MIVTTKQTRKIKSTMKSFALVRRAIENYWKMAKGLPK